MSEPNLHRCIRENKIQASDLEKISLLLGLDIRIFFDLLETSEGVTIANGSAAAVNVHAPINAPITSTNNAGESAVLQERVKLLEQLLEEKERLIKVLLNK